jgi:hypothetical protein
MSGKVLILAITFVLANTLPAQSPVPVIVPAVTPVTTAKVPAAATTTEADNSLPAALKILQDMKAANDEILAKQAATLIQLDELEKEAQQIRIYTKRS